MIAKTLGAVAALSVLALAASGCSAGGGSPAASASENMSGTLTIATWQFLEPQRGDKLFAAVQAYTKTHPNVTIKKIDVTRADYEKTMSAQLGAGQGPDLLVLPDAYFTQLADSNLLEPVDDVVQAAKPASLRPINDNYKWQGKRLAIGWEFVPYALFWNKQILEKAGVTPPTNIDQLIAAENRIKQETGNTGFTVRHQMGEATPWWSDQSNWEFGFGGGWSDGTKLTINSAENVRALEAYKKVYDGSGFGRGQDASTYRAAFKAGQLGMCIDNAAAVVTLLGGSVPADQIGSAALPFPGGGSTLVGTTIGVNANSSNKALAKDWLKWLLTPDTQKAFAIDRFPSVIATDTKADQSLYDQNPWVPAFQQQAQKSSTVIVKGFEKNTSDISTIILTQISRVLTEPGVSAKDALDTAQRQASSKFSK